ncbi:hypothetical protein BLNAU_20474 [Blattamonas nauphoetae]|uniref:Uncharacterized protein n=1 Tax=Blattamonas nauphoetae TaxID=2049346 RepID=A0ABQ9WYL2_9EUKA|nr:hypothetical protein BLNAU_20474 [Blattamonas nauphoetae]
MWIVKPEDVPEYLEKVNHRYKTGVISVSDLLFNECSRMTGPLVKRPKIQLPWSKSTQDFKDCFVMKRNLTVDAQYQLGMRNQHDLHLDTTQRLMNDSALSNDGSSFPFSDLKEEEGEENSLPPQKIPRTRNIKMHESNKKEVIKDKAIQLTRTKQETKKQDVVIVPS